MCIRRAFKRLSVHVTISVKETLQKVNVNALTCNVNKISRHITIKLSIKVQCQSYDLVNCS